MFAPACTVALFVFVEGSQRVRVVAVAELGPPYHFASGEDMSVGRYVWPGRHRGKLTDCRRVLRDRA